MIAQLDEATCPNCQGSPKPKKVCWACRNRGRVEAWRVCSTCGHWIDGCMCPREPRAAPAPVRRSGRPRPRPAPAYPSFTTPAEGNEPPSAERIRGAVFHGDPEPATAEASFGIHEVTTTDSSCGNPATVAIAEPPCWLGVIAGACGMERFGSTFYFCRRCGFVYKEE